MGIRMYVEFNTREELYFCTSIRLDYLLDPVKPILSLGVLQIPVHSEYGQETDPKVWGPLVVHQCAERAQTLKRSWCVDGIWMDNCAAEEYKALWACSLKVCLVGCKRIYWE